MKHTLSRLAVAAVLALAAGAALAQETVQINATVARTCAVVNNTSAVTIANYDPNVGATANGTMTVTCTRGTQYTFDVDNGVAGQASATSRRLAALLPGPVTDFMDYDFLVQTERPGSFSQGAFTSVGLAATGLAGDRALGYATAMTFGFQVAIPAGQDGSTEATTDYTDTVTVTFNW